MSETLSPIVQTDARGRAVLSGHRNQRFIMTDQSDGSVLLVPAVVVSQAQREYDESPELQSLLAKAAASPTVRIKRTRAVRP